MTSSNLAIDRLSRNLEGEEGNDLEYLDALKNLLDLKKLELSEKEKEVLVLKQSWDKEKAEEDNKESRMLKLQEELEKAENEERKMDWVLERGKEKLNSLKEEIERLKEVGEEAVAWKNGVKVVNLSAKLNLDLIRDQIFALNGLSNSYKHDIRNLKRQKNSDPPQSCISF